MPDNYKDVVSLTDDLPESVYSGLSTLPEVKDPVAWLTGEKSRGEFRSMILDEVIPQRKELPEWAKTIDYKTTGEKIIKKTGVLSEGIVGGEDTKLNALGETFYSYKDGIADFFTSMPRTIGTYVASATKALGISPETSTRALEYFDNLKKDNRYNKALRDFRLGVDTDALTNQIAYMFGNMTGLIATAGVAGSGAAAAVLEGIQEGGEYLETDISAQRERKGGLSEYSGEGLGFATIHGIISGLIGKKGVEAKFVDNMGKFTGKQVLKGFIGEGLEEGLQQTSSLVSRKLQNEIYGTETDKKTLKEGILEIGNAIWMGGLGGAAFGSIAYVNNKHYMSEVLQENFGLSKADANLLAKQYMEMSAEAVSRNGKAMRDLSPDSRVMQMAKQQLMADGMEEKQADKVLAKIRRDVIKEQIKKGEELSSNDFYKQTETAEDLYSYIRDKAGIQAVEDSVVEEEKQQIESRREELKQQESQEQAQPTEQVVEQETEVEQKPAEEQVTEERSVEEKQTTPVQLEMNFLNAQENAINQALDIEAPVLPVNQDLLTKQDVQKINDKLEEIENKVAEISEAKTPIQQEQYQVGKQLNSFEKPKMAVSKFSQRVAKQTQTEGVTPVKHRVRDIKAAKKAADELVQNEEDAAWEILENDRADSRGLLKAEVAEALKRKIAKTKNNEMRKQQLRRLITAYADVSTKAGQELRALADDSLVDAVRDIATIEGTATRKLKKVIKNKSANIQKKIDNLVKTDKIMSYKHFWESVREKMECR